MTTKKLYYNAQIYCVDTAFSKANAMLVEDAKILFVGDLADCSAIDESTQKIDMQGKFIYPGWIDPHCHFIDLGRTYFTAALHDCNSFEEVLMHAADFQKSNERTWLLGRGWNNTKWADQSLPNKKQLDILFPNTPVFLVRIDSHVALVNQAAIECSKLKETTLIEEGFVELIEGELSGIVYDKALFYLLPFVQEDESLKRKLIQKAEAVCFSYGLTSVGDAYMEHHDFELFKSMFEERALKINLYGMFIPSPENLAFLIKNNSYRTHKFHINATKHFADGALGSRGAALKEGYSDDPSNTGLSLETDEYWEHAAAFCIAHNLQMITHCIGDAANERIIKLYKKYLKGKNDRRWRIEHVQIIDEELLALFPENDIIPSVQSTHGTSDYKWAINRLGAARMKRAYRIKDLLDTCGFVVNGSDFPIEKPNPLRGFYASITRSNDDGEPAAGFDPSQRISREDAMKSMCIWAAYAQFEEQEKGSLEIGKRADFVVYDIDLLHCKEVDILQAQVLETFIDGESVYKK